LCDPATVVLTRCFKLLSFFTIVTSTDLEWEEGRCERAVTELVKAQAPKHTRNTTHTHPFNGPSMPNQQRQSTEGQNRNTRTAEIQPNTHKTVPALIRNYVTRAGHWPPPWSHVPRKSPSRTSARHTYPTQTRE